MAVVKNLSGLQTAKTGMAPDQTHGVLDELARMWAAQYAQTEERARAIPELPLRASYTSMRCDRALGYAIAKVPYTNPPDITDQIRMWYGTIVHNAVDVALDTLGSWATELPVDLRPIGYAGSATGDLVIYRDEQPVAVFDFKTVGGFAFKQKATAYQGPPQGPSIDQILQPGLAALALGAPKFGVIMFSLEPVSKQQARNVGDQDIDRLWAQWTFDTADWEQDIRAEVARQMRVLQWVQERGPLAPVPPAIHDPELPAGAFGVEPAKGRWEVRDLITGNVAAAGSTWRCTYCRHRDQCAEDGIG